MTESRESVAARIKALRILQWISPAMMLIIAGIVYNTLDPNLNAMVAGLLVVFAAAEFLIFKFLADRVEDQL